MARPGSNTAGTVSLRRTDSVDKAANTVLAPVLFIPSSPLLALYAYNVGGYGLGLLLRQSASSTCKLLPFFSAPYKKSDIIKMEKSLWGV
eukprot:3083548-Amphidinium_carterae.2